MSKESNKNNLEDFFRNSLKSYSENPSNDLWGRIAENIPDKPSKRLKPAYILLALLLLMTIGFGYEYFHFKNQMLTVNETVILQKQELNNLKNQLDIVKGQLQSASQTPNIESKPGDKIEKALSVQSVSKESQSFLIPNIETSKTTFAVSDFGFEKTESINGLTVAKNQEIPNQPVAKLETSEPVNAIDLHDFQPITAKNFTEIELPFLTIPTKRNKPFSLELYASALRTFPNNSKMTGNQAEVKNRELSSDFGALFNLGLSKNWDIQIGVGYNKKVINDAVSADLIYSREELDPARGSTYTSYYSYTVNTPSGETLVNSSLSNQKINDGSDLEVGDPFQLSLQYRDEIHYFQLPVFVRYKIGKGRYRFTMKTGFIQKFLLDEKIKLSSVDADFDRLKNDWSYISNNNQTSAATTSIDALFGAGVEFILSPINSIHLQSTFSYSLKEIYPDLRPISIGLQLGLQHKIGK
jgi:hypothetical protein